MAEPDPFDANLRAALEPAYTLERELVGGGMSRVFLATERSLNRLVVVKVLPPELAAGVNRERFRREVQLAAQLQHPHIVPLYSAGEHGDLLFYTMPFIDGESLKHAIHERKAKARFTPREVVGILHDVVDALAYAHARGVVHRDIKPGNVLRSGRHAVVTDFGVAKAISAALPSVGATTSGMAIGTPAYMAPEQLAGDPAADHRMDIYAVGLLAYELLTGAAPFSEKSPQETLAAQLTRSPAPIANSREDVPEALSALIMKCLEKNPGDRPQAAAELLVELDALAFGSGDYLPMRKPTGRRALALVGGAVVVAALVIVLREQRAAGPDVARPTEVAAKPVAAAPAPLTHADSLAIARAVEKRLAERTAAAPAPVRDDRAMMAKLADSLRAEMMKAVFDSLAKTRPPAPAVPDARMNMPPGADRNIRGFGGGPSPQSVDSMVRSLRDLALGSGFRNRGASQPTREAFNDRAANLGPPRRVLVTLPAEVRGRPDLSLASFAIADSLRRTLAASKRYVIVAPRDSPRSEMLGGPRTMDSVARTTTADMVASLFVSTRRDSSVTWTVLLHDATASEQMATRSASARASKDSLLVPTDSLVSRSVRYLELIDHAPRRGAADPVDHAFEVRAANMGPPRRIVVWDHPLDRQPGLREAGSAVTDVLRKILGNSRRFVPVSRDSTLAVLEGTRNRDAVLNALHSDLMLSIRGNTSRADSVSWVITVWDAGAIAPFSQRSITAARAPLTAPLVRLDTLVAQTIEALHELDHAPRRAPEGPAGAAAPSAIPTPPSPPVKVP